MALAAITDPARPYTRRSFTPLFLEGRAWLAERFREAGLSVRIDAGGNLIGRREGRDPARGVLMVGSHSDTVPSGGRFDGIAGVATALEIARALADAGEQFDHTLEVIDFLAEEPSDFGLSCIGSRATTGTLTAAMLDLTGPGGERLREALRRVGGDPDAIAAAKRDDVRAFIELHIEQGPVLEASRIDVGIVTSIVGIRRIEIVFEGVAGHAGTTPMNRRHDALVAGAATVAGVRAKADELAGTTAGQFVATVGVFDIEPGGSNVIPARCRLMVDIRSTEPARIEQFTQALDALSAGAAEAADVIRSDFATLSNSAPVACDPIVRDALRRGADALDLTAVELASGAGHDAAFMARICRSAMVFVACKDGVSHAPEEWADRDAIAGGAATILQALRDLDRDLPPNGR